MASARVGRSGWLLGRYSSDGLESLLTGDSLPGVGRGYLLDAQGHVLFGGVRDLDRAPLPLDALLAGGEREAVSYQIDTGAPRIGAARQLDQLSRHVAMVAHLDEGFDPIEPLLLQLFLLDVALIFVMVWIFYLLFLSAPRLLLLGLNPKAIAWASFLLSSGYFVWQSLARSAWR